MSSFALFRVTSWIVILSSDCDPPTHTNKHEIDVLFVFFVSFRGSSFSAPTMAIHEFTRNDTN